MPKEWKNGAYKGARKQMTETESSIRFYAKFATECVDTEWENTRRVEAVMHSMMQLRTAKDKFDHAVEIAKWRPWHVNDYSNSTYGTYKNYYTPKQVEQAAAAKVEIESKKAEMDKLVDETMHAVSRKLLIKLRVVA